MNPRIQQEARRFSREVRRTVSLDYLLHTPEGDGPHPLIVFLHGSGERGHDLEAVKRHGPPRLVEAGQDLPFLLASPQCPSNSWWTFELGALEALVEDLLSTLPVDPDRVYLTGLSMGGYGTWALAARRPDLFAAAVVVCGGGNRAEAAWLRSAPVWAFHGAKDDVVPVSEGEAMVRALERAGGEARLTVYPEAGHDSWTRAYDDPEVFAWLLGHRRGER